ncbi:MAG: DUF4856 domain-containing protein [Chlorobi bacterium]|nr:DUF4856 domain-containing protein [Chlorobiota bacterium]
MKYLHHIFLFTFVSLALTSCSDDTVTEPDDDKISVPTTYSFLSRFETDKSSVSYSGQTVRNLLIQDIKILIDQSGKSDGKPVTAADILALYDHNDGDNLMTRTTTGSLPPLETAYPTISTGKNLTGKISGATLIGTNKTVDQMMREWFAEVEILSNDPTRIRTPMAYTDDQGHDLSQLINKVLLGSVVYYQGTGIYLSQVADRDNTVQKGGTALYTDMEHAWDEAFGYYGGARNYFSFSDEDLAGSVDQFTNDANGDGKIDFKSEYNFGFSRNAGKRDKGSSSGTDFTMEIFQKFLEGRTTIVNQGSETDLISARNAVANTWEKVIAATVVHYINETLSDMDGLTNESVPSNSTNLNKHWGEMKGFTWALQFNPLKLISDADLQTLHTYMGDAPAYSPSGEGEHTSYRTALEASRSLLQNVYSFSEADVQNW